MILTLQIVYFISILVSAIVALRFQDLIKSRKLGIMIPFLFWVFAQELTLYLLVDSSSKMSNAIVYHVYRVINVIVFAIIFYRIPIMAPLRKLIVILAALYILVNVMVFGFISPIQLPNTYLSLARGLVISCYAIFFLFSYFSLDNLKDEKYWTPILWISIGILIFYPVISLPLALQGQFASMNLTALYRYIPQTMSIFMYSCFTYAFYLCKKKN